MVRTTAKRKKKKKVKYYKFELKLSQKQKEVIEIYCKRRSSTPNKLIKTAIKEYLIRYEKEFPIYNDIGSNQLVLFAFDEEAEDIEMVAEKES